MFYDFLCSRLNNIMAPYPSKQCQPHPKLYHHIKRVYLPIPNLCARIIFDNKPLRRSYNYVNLGKCTQNCFSIVIF